MLELVLRIGFSLLIVFGLMWALARVVRRPLSGRRTTLARPHMMPRTTSSENAMRTVSSNTRLSPGRSRAARSR